MKGLVKFLFHLRAPILMFAILLVLFGITVPSFLSVGNWVGIFRQSVVLALITYGLSFTVLAGGIDISVGSVLGAGGMLFALLLKAGFPILLAAAAAILLGALLGAVNGWMVTRFEIPPFIATLGMLGMARGITLIMSAGRVVSGLDSAVRSIIAGSFLGLPLPFWTIVVLALVLDIVLQRTPFGTSLYAIGGNVEAAHLAGINVRRNRWITYLFSGALAGGAGIIMVSRLMAGDPMAGELYDFDAIAAAVTGGILITGGRGTASGALLGTVLISVLRNGMDLLHVNYNLQVVAIGAVIIAAYLVDLMLWARPIRLRRRMEGAV